MWMMGYNEGGDFNMTDSCNGRKLRPLMPRVPHAPTANATNPTNCLRNFHGENFIALNHHQLAMSEQNKRDFNTQLVVSSRWNPTPEQLQTLEELYRRGTRTPSAEQIQHITAQLRRYGKIEGKNVFYWFQNHKARERQKRRRQLESSANGNGNGGGGDDQSQSNCNAENAERKDSGANRTVFEIEQTKHWPSPTNCSTLAEKTAAKTNAGAAAAAAGATAAGVAESCRVAAAERWIPFDEGEQRRSLLAERNATWQMMHLSCSPPTINNTNCATICSNTITTATCTPIIRSCPSTPTTVDHQTKQLFKPKDHLNIFITPFRCDQKHQNIIGDEEEEGEGNGHEAQTLELFPLRSSNDDNNDENNFSDKDEIGASANLNNNFNGSHYQFFEFLPLKN